MTVPKNIIYGLIDPRTLLVRYVGKTARGLQRVRRHDKKRTSDQTHCANWVRSLQRLGLRHLWCVLDECSFQKLSEQECWWIAYGRACGWPLTNHSEGGDGAGVGHSVSAATRVKLSSATKKQWQSPSHREHMQRVSERESSKRKLRMIGVNNPTHNPEVRNKLRTSSKQQMANPAARTNLSRRATERFKDPVARASLGVAIKASMTPQRRAIISERTAARMSNPEVRANLSAKHKERMSRPGVLENLREKARAQWARKRALGELKLMIDHTVCTEVPQ